MNDLTQSGQFLGGEGDRWFERNSASLSIAKGLHFIEPYCKPQGELLEVGCSDGRNIAFLAGRCGGRGTGIDPSLAAIESGRSKYPGVDLRVGTSDMLPFKDESFDLIVFGFCLYLVDRNLLLRTVAEGDRVLRNGGFLVITDFCSNRRGKRPYAHREGLFSYRADYPAMWRTFHYALVAHIPFSHSSEGFHADDDERIGHTVLHKDLDGSYPLM
jgi:SAM-dependent methyltransferase